MSQPTSQVTGIVSGIDWETTIQQLMSIERRREDLLSQQKQDDQTKLDLWAQLQNKVTLLQGAAQSIDTRSEFAVKSASSSDTTIVAISAGASAATGAHSVEVSQLAKAHRIAGQGWADQDSSGVGDSGGNLVIQVGDQTITIADADLSSATTLQQLKTLINGSPDNDDLVTASILNDGSQSNAYRLVLTSNATGSANAITVSSNPTNINFNGTAIDSAETAPGWTGTAPINTAGNYTGTANKTFTFTVQGSGTQAIGTAPIDLNWVDSLGNTGTVTIPAGYTGDPIDVAEGVQLSFNAGNLVANQNFNVDVFNSQLTAAQDAHLTVDGIYMSKASNSVSDVLEGVTLNLQSADPGTPVEISVTNDKASTKAKIQTFVDAYNSLRTDLNTYSSYDDTNQVAAPLLGDGFLTEVKSDLSNVISQVFGGLPGGTQYDSLAVVGLNSDSSGMLSIDDTKLDAAMDTNFDGVVSLFTKNFESNDSKIAFVSSGDKTQAGQYNLVVNYDAAGKATSATINGQTAAIDGPLIHGAKGTSLEGLVLSFTSPGSGPGSLSTTFQFGKGVADTFSSAASQITDPDTGPIHFAQQNLTDSIDSLDKQIQAWEDRLATTEQSLRTEYANLETTLSKMKNQSAYLTGALG